MGNLMPSLRAVLISTGVVSAAIILKLCVPPISDFVVSDIPSLYSIMLPYLRPPYLYLLINGIIISILASSKFQPKSDATHNKTANSVLPPAPAVPYRISIDAYNGRFGSEISGNVYNNVGGSGYRYRDVEAVAVDRTAEVPSVNAYNDADGGCNYASRGVTNSLSVDECNADCSSIVRSGYEYRDAAVPVDRTADGCDGGVKAVKSSGLERMDTMELISLSSEVEKPPVSRRFAQRKTVKATTQYPEGKPLGVTKPKRQDTLERTWKKITEGHSMPLTRHLKKSDTWERVQEQRVSPPPPLPNKMKKSDTFSDGNTTTTGPNKNNSPLTRSSGSGKLRKDPSLSHDELNRRVEAFIKKFNEEMRLQRQESLNQYQEMIRQGAH